MNIFSTAILGITAFCLFSGALWGFIRGAVRSAVRFGTVFVAFLIAWICKKTYVAAVFELEIEGSSIGAVLTEALSDVGTLSGIIIPLIESLLGVILFIVVLDLRVEGMLLASFISNMLAGIYILFANPT